MLSDLIVDFDLASYAVACKRKNVFRLGTVPFMSREALDGFSEKYEHGLPHDLESFYWVFCWIVLRHTACHLKGFENDRLTACKKLFVTDSAFSAEGIKLKWFNNDVHIEIPGNVPLTTLANKLTMLASGAYPGPGSNI